MGQPPAVRKIGRKPGLTHARPVRLSFPLPNARAAQRLWRRCRRAPPALQAFAATLLTLVLSLSLNWIYQAARKPTELLFPVSGAFIKTPAQTWRDYGPLFKKYSTANMPAGLLAALAQVEGSGNPVVRTYWRWSWTLRPFEVYRPASSSVGMYQLTDGTFAEARRYCIQNHTVVEASAGKGDPCWLNGLYSRVVPANAVELTSAYLDRAVAGALKKHGLAHASPRHSQALAAVIHLCGARAGDEYVQRGFRLGLHQRCGPHDARLYLAQVDALIAVFDRLAAAMPES